jgi:hypothetical protein
LPKSVDWPDEVVTPYTHAFLHMNAPRPDSPDFDPAGSFVLPLFSG